MAINISCYLILKEADGFLLKIDAHSTLKKGLTGKQNHFNKLINSF
jgi:hypothetical protein